MFILGFESTAHTFGAAVVEVADGKPMSKGKSGKSASRMLLSPKNTKIISELDMKFPSLKEGFIPRKLAEFHSKNFEHILDGALTTAGICMSDLSAVCYSYGPGIGHSLHIGYIAAKSISIANKIPIVPVNHALAHLEIARFHSGFQDPLAIYVSGGNTQILVLEKMPNGNRQYRVLGETLDIGLGNYLDQVGRHLQLSPPDAVGVLKEAQKGNNLIDLPYVIKGMNTSYSGMLTTIKKMEIKKEKIPDICFSAQEYAFSMLLEASERALSLTKKKEIMGVGGNYRNKRLQEMTVELAKEHGIKCHFPSFELLGDNAGMIAIAGALEYVSGCYPKNPEPNQKARVDGEIMGW